MQSFVKTATTYDISWLESRIGKYYPFVSAKVVHQKPLLDFIQ